MAASAAGASNGGGSGQQQQHAATFAGAPAFSREHVAAAMSRVVVLGLRETLDLRPHLHAPAAAATAAAAASAAGATTVAPPDNPNTSSPPFEVTAYYAGHVLGACMFHVRSGDRSVLYTGDHSGLDAGGRHLAAARLPFAAVAATAPHRPPDLCISESTYASSVRGDGGRAARERALLDAVERCVRSGGRALFPVYAVGRAQELMALVEQRWRRSGRGATAGGGGGGGNFQQLQGAEPLSARVPVYAAGGMAARASAAYRLLAGWAAPGAAATEGGVEEDDAEDDDNQSDRFVCSSSRRARAFRFPLVRPLDRAGLERLLRGEDPSGSGSSMGPCVLFASPGTLGGGASLAAFRAWAPDPRNLVVLPSYQVAGTLGCRLLAGETRGVELPGGKRTKQQQRRGAGAAQQQQQQQQDPTRIDVRCQVRYAPFSAHADASGLLRVLDAAAPRAVALVHGDRDGMDFLAARLRRCPPSSSGGGVAAATTQPFPVFCPKTGEEVVVPTDGGVTVLASRAVLDRAAAPAAAGDGSSGGAEEPPEDEKAAARLERALERALARENFGCSARLDDAVLLADRSGPQAGVRLRLVTLDEAVREVEGRFGGGKEAAAEALSSPAAAAPPPPPPVRVGCYVPFLGCGGDDSGHAQVSAALQALSRAGVAIAGTSVRVRTAAAAGAGRLRLSWLPADAALGERCARVLKGETT